MQETGGARGSGGKERGKTKMEDRVWGGGRCKMCEEDRGSKCQVVSNNLRPGVMPMRLYA